MQSKWIPVLLIIVGLILRVYRFHSYPFGFDQVQLLENAEKIIAGNPTLIGPRTGPAPMFTGPFMYYLTAIISMVIPSPYTVVATALVVAGFTGIALFILSKNYVSIKSAYIITALWAISPLLIYLDRIPWNPNISVLAGTLVFFPLYGSLPKNHLDRRAILLIALGIFFGYQAHFSGLMLLPLAFLGWLIGKRHSVIPLIAWPGALILSLLPTIAFDLRHNFLNAHGFVSLLQAQTNATTPFMDRFFHMLTITAENEAKLIGQGSLSYALLIPVGFGVLCLGVYWLCQKPRRLAAYTALWLAVIALGMALYGGSIPEYYFLIEIPALMVLTATLLERLRGGVGITIILCLIGIGSILVLTKNTHNPGQPDMGQLMSAASYVKSQREKQNVAVVYDLPDPDKVGLKYLLRDLKEASEPSTEIHVVYPIAHPEEMTARYGNVGLRLTTTRNE